MNGVLEVEVKQLTLELAEIRTEKEEGVAAS